MAAFTDRFIQVGSARTRYWDVGPATGSLDPGLAGGGVNATGTPVLLLHGIGCSVLEWEHNIAALAQHHRVLAVDLLGFGLTDKPADAPYGLPCLAQFALDFLSAVGVQRAHIAGNSLGGAITMECAHLAPERVASMLLVDPAGVDIKGALLEFRLTSVPVLGELFSKPTHFGTRMLWNKAVFKPAGLVTDELVATKVKLASQPGAQQAFLKTLRSFLGFGGFSVSHVQRLHGLLPTLSAPTLVLWGAQDRFVAPAHAQVLQRLLPNAQVQVWDACGHVPQMEHPRRFNETALAFWGQAGAA